MFDSIKSKFQFQLKFKDRVNAANILAAALSDRLNKQERINSCVLGIPRGGVIVADVVASKLRTNNFNIIIPRKLTIPQNEDMAIGAVMLDGMTYLNHDFEAPSEYIRVERIKKIEEIKRRMQLYLAVDSMKYLDITDIKNNATVIIVDDGVASGSTFIVAARWLKKFYNPRRIIAAATVAPKEIVKMLKDDAVNDVEVITKPHLSSFNYVGQYYQNFAPVPDEQVVQIMKRRNLLH